MTLALTPDQLSFAESAKKWIEARDVRAVTRQILNGEDVDLTSGWQEVADLGWAGLLVPEQHGGSDGTWLDAAILLEALASACSPYPLAPTFAATAVLASEAGAAELLSGVAEGSVRFGVGFTDDAPRMVLGGAWATHVVLPAGDDAHVYDVAACVNTVLAQFDPSAGMSEVTPQGEPALVLTGGAARVRTATRLMLAAEALGVAGGALTMAVEYAKVREAFGRVIGGFQAVKHHCANMLLASQLASASTWRAASAEGTDDLTALVAGAAHLAGTAALTCAKTGLQVMGGIGYTWEHDAHLFLRRAGLLANLMGPLHDLSAEAGRSRIAGTRPGRSLTLPPEADQYDDAVADFKERVLAADPADRHAMIVDEGYLQPHWPAPWGREAGPLEQLVIEETLRGVDRTSALGATHWEIPIILPTVLEWGTEEQIERWMRPSMMGEIKWCQLFSEPSAGSDLASLRTRAVKVDGGWRVTGQKVWTSDAHHADRGMTLVRTNPDAPQHQGITCLMMDLRSEGVDIRPLRQITGEAHFNEIFLDNVFVSNDDVLGPVDSGWKVSRTTLGHERVSLGAATTQWTGGPFWDNVVALVGEQADTRPDLLGKLGRIVHVEEGAVALSLRSVHRSLLGDSTGIEGAISKTIIADLAASVGDLALESVGHRAGFYDGALAIPQAYFLAVRMATIAGGTSEVLRNVLAEQALGLPREPRPTA